MKKWNRWLGTGLLLGTVFLFTGCGTKAVVKVDKEKITLPELMYYVHQAEEEGQIYEEMYQNFFQESYWDMEYEEEKTFRQVAKEDAYENAIMYTIFEKEAIKAGYSLTDEEKEECSKEASEEYAAFTEKQRTALGLSEKEYIALKQKVMLGNKYYDALEESLEVDEDKATSMILEEDYIQIDVEYLYAQNKEELAPYLERAVAGEDFDTLAEENPDILESGALGFIEGDYALGETFEKEALKLSVGEITDKLVEEEDGWYIIKLVDDDSKESYEAACEEAIYQATNEAFQAAYEEIKSGYKITEYASDWDTLEIGDLTVEPVEDDTTDGELVIEGEIEDE
jgi:foldase protein PrsA